MLRILFILVLSLSVVSCASLYKKEKAKKKKQTEIAHQPHIPDASGDMNFEAFLGRLRIAAQRRDMATMASMMTRGFGYSWSQAPGGNVFKYWDKNQMWPDVVSVLNQHFAPKGKYMVAPKKFATDADYHGYRAGIAMVDGSWRFAYFVPDPPQESAPQSQLPRQ